MKLCIKTLGCKVNAYESEAIKEEFLKAGYELTDKFSDADVSIINTCTVTNQADSKSRKLIRQARRENNNTCLVVCGCAAEHHKDALMDLDVDILIGTDERMKLTSMVDTFLKTNVKIKRFTDIRHAEFENMEITHMDGRTRGFIKIQDGCNNYCTFCIIPFMRGRCRSKDLDVALSEIKCMADSGYQEIVLTGIHTGSYGENEDYDLTDLIHEASKIKTLKRIRISSIEITELNDKFLKEFKTNKKICSHLHVPIQSGSNEILKKMNRKYTKEEFINKINELRKLRPDINITTDLIVGFPEETDNNFKETIETCISVGFSKIHVFPYSLRDGTKASLLKQVNDKVKKIRVKEMLELSDELESNYYKKFINKELEVLVEENDFGLSDNYIKISLNMSIKSNTFVNVLITDVDGINVKGKVIE